jgi:hypothetical protein
MIIVCDNTLIPGLTYERYINLTIGKSYIASTDEFQAGNIMIELVDDSGEKCWYPKRNFISLDIYRELKLKELGIV